MQSLPPLASLDDGRSRNTILVVDDTPETLEFLTTTLDLAGFIVLVATDGEAALELVEHVSPDLVLMDAVMPRLDGFETCRKLKLEKRLPFAPVVFMTGLSETEHIVKGLEAGGVDYVTKPIVVDELLARIRVHLENARVAQGSRAALDLSGRYLLALDEAGGLLWSTPRAKALLAKLMVHASDGHPMPWDTVVDSLMRMRSLLANTHPHVTFECGEQALEISFVSPAGAGEYLYRISEVSDKGGWGRLQQALQLTSREAEVLLWVSRGKSNRDIGLILDISPRTVNKHLEQVFVKLGVENRAAAAARAVRILSHG